MALREKKVEVAAGKDFGVKVETDTIFDPQSGVAVQVETVTAAVKLEDGNIAVIRQQPRIVGVAATNQVW